MKRFQFRLKSLLRYREFREQQARQAVSNARRALRDCEADMARLQGRLDKPPPVSRRRASCNSPGLWRGLKPGARPRKRGARRC